MGFPGVWFNLTEELVICMFRITKTKNEHQKYGFSGFVQDVNYVFQPSCRKRTLHVSLDIIIML